MNTVVGYRLNLYRLVTGRITTTFFLRTNEIELKGAIHPAFACVRMEAKLLAASGLLTEPSFRRLFKARHQEMNAMVIRMRPLVATLKADPHASFTVYSVQIRSTLRRGGDSDDWTLAKRYSEFARFRESLLHRVHAWEQALGERERASKQFVLVSNALRKPLTPTFPRKHTRRDTDAIVRERCAGLQEFLRKLLDAYADLSVYIYNSSFTRGFAVGVLRGTTVVARNAATRTVVDDQLHSTFLELEEFLDIPAAQKEVERVQVAAILSLQDVEIDVDLRGEARENKVSSEQVDTVGGDDEATDNCGHVCCICLMGARESAESDGDPTHLMMVKLPCSHKFHEDCVIDWFNASTTCPLCRSMATPPPDLATSNSN
ncbi:hypothetical protein PybrP1_006757 [[Pythium] brassicae (nom. inval.)]|nr:hypothetical protein PybrP1_006757 [[Pythium] brassicae (nom. inval.)]